ncbi:MAG: response regulator [Bryobacterales bacterium]|nr:response regulator [Bryobacterales bacterium]
MPAKEPDTILVVDDDKEFCDTLCERFEVETAQIVPEVIHEAHAAIEFMLSEKGQKLSLAIVDVYLPRADRDRDKPSPFAVEIIRSHQLLKRGTPIIVITGAPSFQDCVECIKAGAYDYIPKYDPIANTANMDALVKECLEIVNPKPDPVAEWVQRNLVELSHSHGGQFLGIMDRARAEGTNLALQHLKDESDSNLFLPGDSMEEIQMKMIHDPVLRWVKPRILWVPQPHSAFRAL